MKQAERSNQGRLNWSFKKITVESLISGHSNSCIKRKIYYNNYCVFIVLINEKNYNGIMDFKNLSSK